MLYNSYYVGQIDDLGIHVGLIIPNGGRSMDK
jgi:hypothetical protein